MKKFITLLLILCCSMLVRAQFEVTGSEEYGRIFNITYHPTIENKLFAVTLGNHIVTSDDNGENWEILYSHPESQTAIQGLRIVDSNKLSFYISYSSSPSLNILDINTLSILQEFILPVPPNSDKNWIVSYSFFEADTDIAIVHQGYSIGLATFAKVYYTTDGGSSWDEVYFNGNYDSVFPNNVAISPDNPQKLFITRGNGPTAVDGGLFISDDAGATWDEKLAGNTFDPIAFHPQDANTILLGTSIGSGSHVQNLYRSTDGGENWTPIPITWTDQTLDNITVITYNPSNPDNIIVLEENEIVVTHDNFQTWDNYVYPIVEVHSYYYGLDASYNPFQGNEVFISGNYHALFSDDGGETVTWSKNPYFVTTGNINIFDSNAASHLYYGVQYGYVHRNMTTMEENAYDIMPLDFVSNSSGIIVYTDPQIEGRVYSFSGGFLGSNLYVSDDHGETKDAVYSLFSNYFHAVAAAPNNPSIIWASFSNFGENPELVEIDFTDLNNIQITPITLPVQDVVTGIYIDPLNPDHKMIAIGTWIYKTTDNGLNWENSSNGLEDMVPIDDLILKLAINPMDEDQFSLATSKGVYTSTDHGENWVKIYNQLVHNVAHSTETNGHIIAVTHNSQLSGFNIVYSTDAGETWDEVPNEALYYIASQATAFQFFEESVAIYMGTTDLGLVKYTLDLTTLNTPDFENVAAWLQLYPNPTTDILHFKLQDEELAAIEIYSLTGQKLKEEYKQNSINISDLATGMYLTKVTTVSGKSTVRRVMKQ